MADIRKILVPVDFSTCSRDALEHAIALSERYYGASIDVLHVWESPRPASSTAVEATRVQAMKEMETLLADHEAKGVIKLHRVHEGGEPVPAILDFAKRGDYDLIVMGTHGRTGMAHDYLGSVAEKVVRRAPAPVLTVRAGGAS
ncbi:MAG: universal stress protein [Planctomycetota bacterium]